MKKLILLIILCVSAHATTTISGNLKDLSTGTIASNAYVRVWLRGCSGNTPRVNGTALISPSNGTQYFKDFRPNSSGAISGTLYSTRDAAGTGNGEIECGGSLTAVWYGIQIFGNGIGGPEMPVNAKNGATLDLTNVTPITTNPVVTAPTGDSTYARLDAGNTPFTGAVTGPSFNNVKTIGPGGYSSSQACLDAIPTATYATCPDAIGLCWTGGGGVCVGAPGWTETLSADLVLTHDKKLFYNSPTVITQGSFKVRCDNVAINGGACSGAGIEGIGHNNHNEATSGVTFNYSGSGDQFQIGDGVTPVGVFTLRNIQIHCIDGNANCTALHLNKAGSGLYENLDLVCSSSSVNTGNALLIDDTTSVLNKFFHLVPNFCNTPIRLNGASNNSFTHTIFGGPQGTPGAAYTFNNANNNKVEIDFNSSYTPYFSFTGTSKGNEIHTFHSVTTDLSFGASTTGNVAYCLDGGGACAVSDSGTNNTVWTSNIKVDVNGDVTLRRIKPTKGTALSSGDFNLASGPSWGSTASVSTILGTDSAFVLIVTSAGTGQAANPIAVLTYKDGSFGTGSIPVCIRGDGNNPATAYWTTSTGPSAFSLTFVGTPVAGQTYQANCIVVGR